MALWSIIFLVVVLVIIITTLLLFKENIYWQRLFGKDSNDALAKSSKNLDLITEKFKRTRLYQSLLNSLDLEVCEAPHFQSIGDNFESFADLSDAIRDAGLESSNVIIGIDFSASNEFQGKNTFDHKSLHGLVKKKYNPYQQVITTLAAVLEPFDDDNLIPAYGFGDERTKDKSVFSINNHNIEHPCKGFLEVLLKYEDIVKTITMSGPTSLVPIIRKAIEITTQTMTYNILVIIADGQVEKDQDEETRKIIIEASSYPLSIILVGVGDGPWERMFTYDEKLPLRKFDNFQFVDYFSCIQKSTKSPELVFALNALMEIPEQYATIKNLGLIKGNSLRTKKQSIHDDLKNMKPVNLSKSNSLNHGSPSSTHLRKLSSLPGMTTKKLI